MPNLKPCPFCGCTDVAMQREFRDGYEECEDDPDAWHYYVWCAGCAALGGPGKTQTMATVQWNQRHAESQSRNARL